MKQDSGLIPILSREYSHVRFAQNERIMGKMGLITTPWGGRCRTKHEGCGMTGELADEIRRRMKAGGFNQKSLARAAGLNETAVRDILIGKSRHPRHDTIQKIASALDCTAAKLIGVG